MERERDKQYVRALITEIKRLFNIYNAGKCGAIKHLRVFLMPKPLTLHQTNTEEDESPKQPACV